MRIHLLKNLSETENINKELIFMGSFEGTLRNATSLLNPVIELQIDKYLDLDTLMDVSYIDNDIEYDLTYIDDGIEYDVEAYSGKSSIFECNYMYIEEFKRYYFVTDINIINSNSFIFTLTGDPIVSNRESILELEALVERNEFIYNDLLEDNLSSYNYNKDIEILELIDDRWDKFNTALNRSGDEPNYYAYNIIWSAFSTGQDVDYDSEGMGGVVSTTQQGYAKGTKVICLSNHLDLEGVVESYASNDKRATYLKNLAVYPLTPHYLGDHVHAAVSVHGGVSANEIDYKPVEIVTDEFLIAEYKFPKFESYMDFAPYTKYELYAPYHSYIELNPEDINDSDIELKYLVNYLTGESYIQVISIYKDSSNIRHEKLLYSSPCQLATKVPVDTTNEYEINKEKDALKISTALGVVSSTMQIAMGWASYNPMMMASGGMGLASTLGNVVSKANQFYVTGKIDSSKADFNNFNPLRAHLKITRMTKNNDNNKFIKYYGKPLNRVRQLKLLKGFTKVSEIHLENIDALDSEKAIIESLLKSGIII